MSVFSPPSTSEFGEGRCVYCLIIKLPTVESEQAESGCDAVVRGAVEMSLSQAAQPRVPPS